MSEVLDKFMLMEYFAHLCSIVPVTLQNSASSPRRAGCLHTNTNILGKNSRGMSKHMLMESLLPASVGSPDVYEGNINTRCLSVAGEESLKG